MQIKRGENALTGLNYERNIEKEQEKQRKYLMYIIIGIKKLI